MILNQIHSDILRRPERRMWVSTMVVALYLLTGVVYGGMPMLNYLTSTRPAIHCCWPELLSSELLRQQLSEMRTSPMVLRQKFVTMGSEFSAPTPRMLHTYGNAKSNFCIDTKIAVLNHFLASRRYQIVWENACFVLYRPGI